MDSARYRNTSSSESAEFAESGSEGSDVSVEKAQIGDIARDVTIGPEKKLSYWEHKAQSALRRKKFDAGIQAQVRCTALARIVYGDRHLKLADAHIRLAESYLHLKEWPLQAQGHASKGRANLPDAGTQNRPDILKSLFTVSYVEGRSALLLGQLGEAEASLTRADEVFRELQQLGMVNNEGQNKEFQLASTLSRLYQLQGRATLALCQCERALQLAGHDAEVCAIYRDMAMLEETEGRVEKAVEHLQKARTLAQESDPGGMEEAHTTHSLALVYSRTGLCEHRDSAECCFKESQSSYRRLLGPQDALTLNVQDDYCRFMLLHGQQETALKIQKESLPMKRDTFGDISGEVAETLLLIGGMEMSLGDTQQAHKTMRKCLEIQVLLYGPQHRKTRTTQQTVDLLSKAPEVARSPQWANSLTSRPRFCAVTPSHSILDAPKSDSERVKKGSKTFAPMKTV